MYDDTGEDCSQFWAEAEWMPLEYAVEFLCHSGLPGCAVAKKAAIVSACGRREIRWRRNDGKFFPEDPIESLADRDILSVHRETLAEWAEKFAKETNTASPSIPRDSGRNVSRETLLKLVLGMAMAKYDYKPGGRNTATGGNNGSIYADIEGIGVFKSPDADTIRRALDEAAAEILPSRQEPWRR